MWMFVQPETANFLPWDYRKQTHSQRLFHGSNLCNMIKFIGDKTCHQCGYASFYPHKFAFSVGR